MYKSIGLTMFFSLIPCLSLADSLASSDQIDIETVDSYRTTINSVVIEPGDSVLNVKGRLLAKPGYRRLVMGDVYAEALDAEGRITASATAIPVLRTHSMGTPRFSVSLGADPGQVKTVRITQRVFPD